MKRLARRRLAWIAIVALAAAPVVATSSRWVTPTSRAQARLLGPLLPLAATVQWVRVEAAMRDGLPQLVIARAETLFELEPDPTDARMFVSSYLAFDVASPERESDPERRARWLRAALDIARRGEVASAAPAELACWQGALLERASDHDPQIAWPDGASGLLRDAASEFERAAGLGRADAGEHARRLRERAGER